MLRDGVCKFVNERVERNIPAHLFTIIATCGTHLRMQRTTIRRRGQVERAAFGAQAAEVRGMIGITTHGGDICAIRCRQHAAANAAVGARCFYFIHLARFTLAA